MAGSTETCDLQAALARIAELEESLAREVSSKDNLIQKAIIDQSPVGISVRDRNGNLVLCNSQWVKIWEMSDESVSKLLSRKSEELKLDETDNYLGTGIESVNSVYKNGGDVFLDNMYLPQLEKWVSQRFYGVMNSNGDVDSVVILTEDVTGRRKALAAEKELQITVQKYHTLVKNLPVAAYTTDFNGNTISANPAMVRMFLAESESDLCSTPIWKRYLYPSEREIFLEELKSRGELDNYKVELVRSDGSPFWASVSANVTLSNEGEIETIDGIIRDVSAAKALEAEMLKAKKLESIGLLAGGIAHDFNNIMAAVLGNISLAKLYSSNNARALDKLENAEKASLRASELTSQLLTFSSGGLPVRKISNIQGILQESASFAVGGSEAKLIVDLPEDLFAVDIDESQIRLVINNLVLNSIQAMPGGGEIEVTAENTTLGVNNEFSLDSGSYLKIIVKDNGTGIPHDEQSRIFDPYFSTKSKGSGLGLAAVYSIVMKHGGRVTVESEQGEGAKFFLYLPASGATVQSEDCKTVKREGNSKRIKVLVMDDEEPVLEVVTEILNQNGFDTGRALDGVEAVRMYKEAFLSGDKYDLLIMDVTVPGGVGGVEAQKMILEFDSSARAVVASGYANNTVMANCRDFGFVDSLPKPFTIAALLDTVRNALDTDYEIVK